LLLFFIATFSNANARFFVKDFEKAKQLAAKENKLVLLLFSCGDG